VAKKLVSSLSEDIDVVDVLPVPAPATFLPLGSFAAMNAFGFTHGMTYDCCPPLLLPVLFPLPFALPLATSFPFPPPFIPFNPLCLASCMLGFSSSWIILPHTKCSSALLFHSVVYRGRCGGCRSLISIVFTGDTPDCDTTSTDRCKYPYCICATRSTLTICVVFCNSASQNRRMSPTLNGDCLACSVGFELEIEEAMARPGARSKSFYR
jgi:hypothetical protein